MKKESEDVCSINNSTRKSQTSIKRSNARVGNFNLRCRTKSENGILCGDSDLTVKIDPNEAVQFQSIDKEAEQFIQLRNRPHKRHINNTQDSPELIVTAIYSYAPNNEDELELQPGDKVRVLSSDFRDSGTEGWWVGQRDSQIGVFPMNFVNNETSWSIVKTDNDRNVPEITPRTPNENFKINLSTENSLKRGKLETSSCKLSNNIINNITNINNNVIDNNNGNNNNNNLSNTNTQALCRTAGVRTIPSEEIEKLECLGSGAFGVVYHGRWQSKEVAMKTFSVNSKEVHIYQEAGHLGCLLHRNIVRLFGISIFNEMSNQIALIMEYAKGGALHNLLHFRPHIKLSPRTLLILSRQIALGMRYLHIDAGICHRDLKSSNVLIKEAISDDATDAQISKCTLLITDFGMARRTVELVSQQSKLGTLAYAAPEVCKQQGVFSTKSDVWSYGVLLWELLTMEIPYRDVEQPHLLYKIAFKNQTLYIPDGIPTLLVKLLQNCWAEDKNTRPDFEQIVAVLHRAEKYKFMDISSEEFFIIQENWREQIRIAEKMNDESMNSSDSEKDEFLEQRRELAYAQEELQKREEDMQRREAACSRAMGTFSQWMLYTVLAANPFPRLPGTEDSTGPTPPVAPPRKLPFVGRLKFWVNNGNNSGNNHHHHHHHYSPDTGTPLTSEDNTGNPNISGPSNLQHVVHISQQDFNLTSPALRFFPDSLKMRTWGPKSNEKMSFGNRSRLKSSDETDQETLSPPNQFNYEESRLMTEYADSIESPSPCVETPSSTCGVTIQGESNLCASAPNLRKISLGTLPVFEFSSFRRPITESIKVDEDPIDPPAISNCPSCYFKWLDHRKRIPCERCRWRNTNRSATIGTPTTKSNICSESETWTCIPKYPPESIDLRSRSESEQNRKFSYSQPFDSKRNKKSRCRRNNKSEWRKVDHALWSVMRMLSAVALPDRSSVTSKETLTNVSAPSFDNLEKPQTFRDSCSPTLSLDIPTEDEDLLPSANNDSIFYFQSSEQIPSPIKSFSSKQSSVSGFKPVTSPKPSAFQLSSRGRSKQSYNPAIDKHFKYKSPIKNDSLPSGRGSSAPPSRNLNLISNPPDQNKESYVNSNYFASWLPPVNLNSDLKSGSQSSANQYRNCDKVL